MVVAAVDARRHPAARVRRRLLDTFAWRDTPGGTFADLSGWWRDAEVLALLGPALAALHARSTSRRSPTTATAATAATPTTATLTTTASAREAPATGQADPGAATVVAGTETRGLLLGPLTAVRLGVGFVEVRKDNRSRTLGDAQRPAGDALLRATTPPEYQDGGLTLVVPRQVFRPGDRVLFVDEWIDTGAQANAVRRMVVEAGAQWAGAAVVVDACTARVRERLDVRGLLREDELPG